jgi:glycosyltransferase involved in cell wall biosynthesis
MIGCIVWDENRMKILFLLTQDLQSPSGLGRYLPLAEELVHLGHEVRIAALHSDFDQLEEKSTTIKGVEVNYVAPMHVRKQGSQKSYYSPLKLIAVSLRATWQLTRAALQTPADVIQIAKPHPMNSIAGLIAGFLRRKPLFVDCDDYEAESNRFAGRWQKVGLVFFEKRVPRRVKIATTNTYFMRENLIRWGVPAEKIVYLPNGVDAERFRAPDAGAVAELRHKLNLNGKRVVAYIGSLSLLSHPVDLLLQAFQQIQQIIPNAVLLLVGGGENITELRGQAQVLGIEEDTLFTGRMLPEEVPLYYALADVTVDPVHDDAAARGRSPLKLFESWICGVPFVTADVGDRRSLVGEPPAGILVKPGDPASLADGILRVLTDVGEAKNLSERGMQRVDKFLWQNLVHQVNAAYLKD